MNSRPMTLTAAPLQPVHQLRFESLFNPGRGVAVPCDARGQVDLDALSERQKLAYLGARALVGREYAYPVVLPVH